MGLLLNSPTFSVFVFVSSLIADGAYQRATTLPVPRVGSTHLSPVHAYEFLSRCRFSTPTPRQPIVELLVLTSSHFPLQRAEEKCTPAETRTHKFRLSGCMLHPLDHGGSLHTQGALALPAAREKQINYVRPSTFPLHFGLPECSIVLGWVFVSSTHRLVPGTNIYIYIYIYSVIYADAWWTRSIQR